MLKEARRCSLREKNMFANCRACNYTQLSKSGFICTFQDILLLWAVAKVPCMQAPSFWSYFRTRRTKKSQDTLACVDDALQDGGVRVPGPGAGPHAW